MAKLKGGTRIYGDVKIDGGIYDSSNQVGAGGSVLISTGVGIAWTTSVGSGSQGAQGLQGTQGTQGLQGRQGTQGSQGTQGLQGNQGVQGVQGLQGNQGVQGRQGSQGTQGTQGLQGLQGVQGVQGSVGIQGNTGTQGLTGSFGGAAFDYTFDSSIIDADPGQGQLRLNQIGVTTATYLYINNDDDNFVDITSFLQTIDDSTSNIKGHFTIAQKGNQAYFGLFSIVGVHTEYANYFAVPIAYVSGITTSFTENLDIIITFARTGDKGDTGSQGTQGTQGIQGVQGVQGVQGLQGTQGIKGRVNVYNQSSSVGINSIEGDLWIDSDNGTMYTYYYDGDSYQWVEFGPDPTGSDGAQGIAGTFAGQGTQGLQGLQGGGGQGAQGLQGNQGVGSQGTQGTQGLQGNQGTQGLQGTQGVGSQGSQGTQGLQGTQGTQGLQGNQGTQGTQGTQGLQGLQGLQGTQGTTGAAGVSATGRIWYFAQENADITGYESLIPDTPDADPQDDMTAVVNSTSGEVGIATFITRVGDPGVTEIPTGEYEIRFWAYVSDATGITTFTFKNYIRDYLGTETFLFQVTSNEVNATTIGGAEYSTKLLVNTSPISIASSDRLLTKVVAATTNGSNVTAHFLHSGATPSSWRTAITQGYVGPQGTQGLSNQGTQGLQGLQGAQGLQGNQGVQGRQGSQGTQGLQGSQGTQGLQGNQGLQGGGGQGTQGLQGLEGERPETTTYLPTSISMEVGVGSYSSGTLAGIQTYGDYTNPDGFYGLYDTATTPGYDVRVGFTSVTQFNRISANINYQGSSTHTVEIDLYNWNTSSWETFQTFTGLGTFTTFQPGVIDSAPFINSGIVSARVYHLSGGFPSHYTQIDYFALEDSIAGGQGPRGVQGTIGQQGTQGLQGTQGVGSQGSQGTQGAQGTQGLQGLQGLQGVGSQGLQGIQGGGGQGTQGTFGPATIPQNSQTTGYTLVSSDNGKHISITTGGITVPANVFAVGENVVIYNNSSSSQTITEGANITLRYAGTTQTGNRTLSSYGVCTVLCIDSTTNANIFIISGAGLT